jgi:hypothetical protein
MIESVRIRPGAIVKPFAAAMIICLARFSAYGEGTIDALKEYEYWPDGKVRGCKILDKNGKLRVRSFNRPDGSVEKIDKYDTSGNKVQEGRFDPKGKLTAGLDGWAVMKWEYDGDSRVRSEISFDELGRPLERRLYSPGGKMIMRQVRDSDRLDPYEEAQMAMFLGGMNMKMRNPDE